MKKTHLKIWKANVLIIVCAVLLTIFCVIMLIKPNRTYYFEGEMFFGSGVKQDNIPIYTNIELPVGVYDILLEYHADSSLNSLITAVDGTVFYGGLLTNGEPLYKNLTHTDYRMWLLESTEALQVVLTYGGEGSVTIGNLMICETNFLWIQILVITWSIISVWFVFYKIRKYDELVGIEKDKKNIVVGLFVIILLSSVPFMQKGFLSGGDLGYHLHRIEGVKDGILSGQFPLRIDPEWLWGHGYANSVFYCNTLLYIPALFRLLGFTIGASYRLFCVILNIFTVIIAYWCFGRMFQDRYIGLLCSALHTLSIYRLYKLVVCGAVGESSAFMFLPLILYGFYRAFTQDVNDKAYKTVWIPIAAGYAGVMQTHVLSCEILAFLTTFVCIIFLKKILRKQTFLVLAKGAIAAILMSIWYWVPFLDFYLNEDVHIHYVSGRQIQNQGVYLAQVFFHWWQAGSNPLPGDYGMTDSDAMGVGFVLGFAFLVFIVLWFGGRFEKERIEKKPILSLGKISCVCGGVFMLMSLNIFPWDRLQKIHPLAAALISSIQFTDRFFGWGTVFLVAVGGCLLWYFKYQKDRWYYYIGIVSVVIGLATSSMYYTDWVCFDKGKVYLYNEEGMGTGYISGAEYLPEGTISELLDYRDPISSEEIEITDYAKNYLNIRLACSNEGVNEGSIDLPLLYYTGYQACDIQTGKKLELVRGDNNVVRVQIPVGFDGEIEIRFVSPISWRISEIITYSWWIFVVVIGVRYWKKSGKRCRCFCENMKGREHNYV